MFWFQFDQNCTKDEEFDFFEGQGGGEEEVNLHFKILLLNIIGKYMKIFFFKFQQNRTVNKNFTFLRGGGGGEGTRTLNSKF